MDTQNTQLTIKMTKEEKGLLKEISNKIGLSCSSFVRTTAIEKALKLSKEIK